MTRSTDIEGGIQPGGVFTLVLEKEDFKFSCAHFTIFGPDDAELLHGHNYHVSVELQGEKLDSEGLLASFVDVKRAVRAACAYFDERTLVPTRSPHVALRTENDEVEIRYRERRYVLPSADVLELPLVNTSIEEMALLLWRDLVDTVDLQGVDTLGVNVSETAGQSCWYRARIKT
ncbi:MAG: 6-carboxytetrahydropterin synthase [Thermoanaerobaculia bacterium]|nr:6-carboxytetrahydropterin synthase [Thermoanaerobaculia bacterium]